MRIPFVELSFTVMSQVDERKSIISVYLRLH